MPPPITRMSTDCAVKPHPSPRRRAIKKHRREAVPVGPKRPYFHAKLVPAGDHGRHRYHQSPFRHLLLGDGAMHRPVGEAREPSAACLALLAALVPDRHDVTLIDENVEDIDFSRLARADLVCLTGMSIQGRRLREILERVSSLGVMTVVGGPLTTVEEEEEAVDGLADVVFVGEADETWPQFLRDWELGCHKSR